MMTPPRLLAVALAVGCLDLTLSTGWAQAPSPATEFTTSLSLTGRGELDQNGFEGIELETRVSPFYRSAVLPILSVRWQASEAWLVSLGAPRTEVAYSLKKDTSVFAAATYEGYTFAVEDRKLSQWTSSPAESYAKLEFTEVSLSLGLRHRYRSIFGYSSRAVSPF